MSINPLKQHEGHKIDTLEQRVLELENARQSDSYIAKMGGVVFAGQKDSFFTDADNEIEGLVAMKSSDHKLYLYDGTTWIDLTT